MFPLRKRHIINLAKTNYFTVFGANSSENHANKSKTLGKENGERLILPFFGQLWIVGTYPRTELDPIFHKPSLNLLRKKLHPAVGLDALYWKRQLLKHLVQKIKRVAGCAFFVDLEHPVARTVVYCRVLGRVPTMKT